MLSMILRSAASGGAALISPSLRKHAPDDTGGHTARAKIRHRLPGGSRTAAAALAVCGLLSGCAVLWSGPDTARRSVSLSAPGSIERSARVRQLVERMDAEAFPGDPLTLKLSYGLATPPRVEAARRVADPRG